MKRKEIPVALQPDLKFRYECTDESIRNLARCAGMSVEPFRLRVKELGWRAQRLDRIGRRQMVTIRAVEEPFVTPEHYEAGRATIQQGGEAVDTLTLAGRIRGAIERELAAIEQARKKIDSRHSVHTESVARVLTGLTRALQEARRLEVGALPPSVPLPSQEQKAGDVDDDPVPTDRDELRRALAERIEKFVASRTAPGLSGDPKDDVD
jgi:hypothetical protein